MGLGWIRGTVRRPHEDLVELLGRFFGPPEARSGGTRWYRSSLGLGDGTVLVAWEGVGEASGTTLVDVHQAALDSLGWDRSLELLGELHELGVRCSRLDIYADDRQVRARPVDVLAAVEGGDAVTHARTWKDERNSAGGHTFYLGTRTSERLLRVYLKPDELGERVRWEIETHDESARYLVDVIRATFRITGREGAIATAPVQLPGAAIATGSPGAISSLRRDGETSPGGLFFGYLAGFVDFRERVDGSRAREAGARLAWWAELVGSAERVRGRVAQVFDSLERRARWLGHQVAPTLAQVWATYGDRWLDELLSDGLTRAEDRRFAWASAAT